MLGLPACLLICLDEAREHEGVQVSRPSHLRSRSVMVMVKHMLALVNACTAGDKLRGNTNSDNSDTRLRLRVGCGLGVDLGGPRRRRDAGAGTGAGAGGDTLGGPENLAQNSRERA